MAKPSAQGRRVARPSKFNGDTFEALADDLKSKRVPLGKVTLGDEEQTGLRAIIRDTGSITFHVQYTTKDGRRPWLILGEYPKMKVAEARSLAATVIELGDKGVDVQEGLHTRLINELKEKGARWRP